MRDSSSKKKKRKEKKRDTPPFAHTYGCPQPRSEEAASSSGLLRRVGPSVGWLGPHHHHHSVVLCVEECVEEFLLGASQTGGTRSDDRTDLGPRPLFIVVAASRSLYAEGKTVFYWGGTHKLLARGCRAASCSGPTESKTE